MGAMLVAAWVVLPTIFGPNPANSQVVLSTAAVVWVTGMACFILVAKLAPGGVMPTVYGYFIGMMVRLPVCLVLALYLNRILGISGGPIMVALAFSYLPALAIEAAFTGRCLWMKDFQEPRIEAGPAHLQAKSSEVTA